MNYDFFKASDREVEHLDVKFEFDDSRSEFGGTGTDPDIKYIFITRENKQLEFGSLLRSRSSFYNEIIPREFCKLLVHVNLIKI